MNAPMNPDRREFMKASGALVVGIALAPELAIAQGAPAALPGSLNNNRMLSSWLRINPSGTVTVFSGKIELGQGIGTALAQIAADELDVDYAQIEMVNGDTTRTPDEGQTAGSLSVQMSGNAVKFACAEARSLLLGAAAAKLGVPVSELNVANGVITGPGGVKTTYAEVTSDAMLHREATAQVKPKATSQLKWVGQSLVRRDIPAKFTGGAVYVQDMRPAGMVHARVIRPPSPGATLTGYDDKKMGPMPGLVSVVRDGNFLAVVCEREEQAVNAQRMLRAAAQWKTVELPRTLVDTFNLATPDIPSTDSVVNEKKSATPVAIAKRVEARYTRPYLSHGSIGPSCALAQWKDGKLSVWTHSQGVFPLRGDLSRAFKVDERSIECIHVEGSGCYGQNGADDVAFDAALIARWVPGKPIRVQWMREDEAMWEPFGSPMIMKMGAGLDAAGNIVDWNHELWSYPHTTRPGDPKGVNLLGAWHMANPATPPYPTEPPMPAGGSDRNSVPGYEFPQQRIVKHYIPDMPIRTSALRTLGAYANVFAAESFMDESALAAGVDPVEFRLRHQKDPRARAVIEATASKAGWQANAKGTADGDILRGRGIAYSRYKNLACYCAVVADVEVNRKTGAIRVTRTWSAIDAGLAVNPDGIVNQTEGGIIQSISWTLKEAVKFDRKGIQSRSWADYPILKFSEVPSCEVVVMNQPNAPYLGVGEGSQGPAAAAVANAFANATGRRLRDIPFTPDKVRAILA